MVGVGVRAGGGGADRGGGVESREARVHVRACLRACTLLHMRVTILARMHMLTYGCANTCTCVGCRMQAGIRALRRTYPQIYMEDHRLKIDKDKLFVTEQVLNARESLGSTLVHSQCTSSFTCVTHGWQKTLQILYVHTNTGTRDSVRH